MHDVGSPFGSCEILHSQGSTAMITDARIGYHLPPHPDQGWSGAATEEGRMEFPSPAARIGVDLRGSTSSTEAELARLRAQVAWLRAERAALWWAVGHDDLTGLANRRLFATLAPSLLQIGRPTAVIVLDLNGFKPVNDTLGHEAGDLVLRIVGNRLASCAGTDVVARLGGDEFSCVLTSPHRAAPDNWWRPSVTALSAAIAEPMLVDGHLVHVTASIGVAPACGGVLLDELLRRADLAMYHAKATGDRYAAWEWGGPTWAAPRAGGHRADAPDGEGPGRRRARRHVPTPRPGLGLPPAGVAAGRGGERVEPGGDGHLPVRRGRRYRRRHHGRRVRRGPRRGRPAARSATPVVAPAGGAARVAQDPLRANR